MDPDPRFRFSVIAGGALLVAVMSYVRFCGSLSLPAKPPAPTGPSGTQRELLVRSTGTTSVYQSYVERDASSAGVAVPSLDAMGRKFPYRVDEARHVLELGKPAIELAGVRLHLQRSGEVVSLVIQNLLDSDIAYQVTTTANVPLSACLRAGAAPFNAMAIAKRASETRTECAWSQDLAIIVTRVETMEVPTLSAWYLAQVPPQVVGIEDRIARGHRPPTRSRCSPIQSAAVRSGLERGDIGWRDLADFYARHRCETYQFSSTYRAFKQDNERALPAVDAAQ